MEFIIVALVLGGLVALIATQVAARRQLDVQVPRSRTDSAQVVEKYFGPVWTRVSGPGTYNFRPKLRMHAPTISVNVHGTDVASQISVWTSDYRTVYGGMYHAGLMARKKRGLGKRLLAVNLAPGPRLSA